MAKKKSGCCLTTLIIPVLLIGGIASLFENDKTSDEIIEENGGVWASEYTDIDEFDYYVNGNEIIITDHKGDSKLLNICHEYGDDKVVRFEGAPFMSSEAISVIIPEGTVSMDNNVFNSCDIEYLYLPSTLTEIEDRFWDYFHDVKELYYGGTQEQWDAICEIDRSSLDVRELYCNVSISDLGTEKAKEIPIFMKEVNKEETEYDYNYSQETQEEKSPEELFIEDSSEYLPEEISKKLYSIITNDLGFDEAEFLGKNDAGDSIWDIYCDDVSAMAVASDDVYRIWSGGYTFYEDGTIVTTKDQMESTRITSSEQTNYYLIAQEIVMQNLKNPGSADFPSIVLHHEEIGMEKEDDIVAVQSYVDATNSFGGQVRSQWTVEFRVIDLDSFSYETLYINIDGKSAGTYVGLN